jgi:hypothetical protein
LLEDFRAIRRAITLRRPSCDEVRRRAFGIGTNLCKRGIAKLARRGLADSLIDQFARLILAAHLGVHKFSLSAFGANFGFMTDESILRGKHDEFCRLVAGA